MRRDFLLALASGWMTLALDAQPLPREPSVRHVGFLNVGPSPGEGRVPGPLRQAMLELGWQEGVNVSYSSRSADSAGARLAPLAAELLAAKVDVIVARGSKAARAMRDATTTVPVVFIGSGDPIGTGIVASLSHPGGNFTGLSDQSDELSAKRLEILKELVPKAERVSVLWNVDDLAMTLRYREIERAARTMGVSLQPLGVREPEDFDAAFSAMNRQRPDALMLRTDSLTNLRRQRVVEFAATQRIAAMYEYAFVVREGGLVCYGPDLDEMTARAAVYVDRILKGARAGDLPVEQPTRYDLLVNLRTAATLGLTVPELIRLRASELIG
jgi:putative ABC transport system substrate-binding protein